MFEKMNSILYYFRFYELPSVNDFIIDTVLGSPAQVVRKKAVEQFIRFVLT